MLSEEIAEIQVGLGKLHVSRVVAKVTSIFDLSINKRVGDEPMTHQRIKVVRVPARGERPKRFSQQLELHRGKCERSNRHGVDTHACMMC
jgi:hypothetical protein